MVQWLKRRLMIVVLVGMGSFGVGFADCPEATPADALVVVPVDLIKRLSITSPFSSKVQYLVPQAVVLQKQTNKTLMLIDSRRPERYQQVHIPGSLNIPAYALKTKAYLKSRALVLVAADDGDSALEKIAQGLLASNFNSVSILVGGLNAWRQKGLPLVGTVAARMALREITPAAYYQAKANTWLVIDIRESAAAKLTFTGNVNRIGYRADKDGFFKKLSTVIAQQSDPVSILIVDENGQGFAELDRRLASIDAANIYFLAGGVQAYHKFQRYQQALKQGKQRSALRQREALPCR